MTSELRCVKCGEVVEIENGQPVHREHGEPEPVEPDYMNDWPIVRRLAATQVAKLENHRHDRGLDGWMNEEPHWLLQRLRDEVEELAANPSWEEAADVANFAAMFVDVSRLLVDPPGGE